MSDLFVMPSENKYGIESFKNLVAAANSVYDLFEITYLDDRKFGTDDLVDLIGAGPVTITNIIQAANTAKDLGKEGSDLTEAEKSELVSLAGARFRNPAYSKIFRGVADMADGISELINPANPTD